MRRTVRLLALLLVSWQAAPASAALDAQTLQRLAAEDSEEKIAAIQKLAREPGPAAARVLKALSEDALQTAGGRVILVDGEQVVDASTGERIDPPPEGAESITINNRVRRELAGAMASFRLFDPDRQIRLAAAEELATEATLDAAPTLERALVQETDGRVRALLTLAHARANLKSPDGTVRLAAVRALGASGSSGVKTLLSGLLDAGNEPDAAVRHEAAESLRSIDLRLAVGEAIGRVFSGLSLGSILLLAALGLAIIYGVMGVINMAHGELLMVGAYATFLTQNVLHRALPGAENWYLIAAIPVAFLSSAAVGVAMERAVVRFLYGRPLETLLATWGLSLFFIQSARTIFGPQNVQVANPSWMSGGVEIVTNAVLPWNRIVIILFSLVVLSLVWFLMNRTRLGMFVRAVTQNRAMAGCVGVPTGRMDMLAFGVGAGIAGLGGAALSQIANVGPDMGQSYIVDSFMVVVLGGVGQLAGAVWAALGLGVTAKFLEGWVGAVIAKIVVLAFIIVFIQKRPQGLFALKGRFVES